MKSITYEEFLEFNPYYIDDLDDLEQKALMDIAKRKERWTALDILDHEEIRDEKKLSLVLREELIDEQTLHEFACVCAEQALSRVENPDPRSVAVIAAKRAWVRGEITDKELDVARAAAWDAVRGAAKASARVAAWATARDAALAAADAAEMAAADAAEMAAAGDFARDAAKESRRPAWDAARAAERTWQVEELKKMLKEAKA